MKTLISLAALVNFLFINSEIRANHVEAADLWYEYIGDSSGISNHYMVYLSIHGELGSTINVSVSSSCFNNISLMFQRFYRPGDSVLTNGGIFPPNLRCAPGTVTMKPLHNYKGDIVLPDTCSDIIFGWHLCCSSPVDNLENGSNGAYVGAWALLDNTKGPNSSPRILSSALEYFCVGNQVNWSQFAREEDGDSLYYELNDINSWSSGYNHSQPMNSSTPVQMDSITGDFQFTPSQIETDELYFTISEFRYDTTAQDWYKIGEADRSAQLHVIGSCSHAASEVVLSDPNFTGPGMSQISCGDSLIRLSSSSSINPQSLAPDGSDFALLNSQGHLVPIAAAGFDTVTTSGTQEFWLRLHSPISYNDTLTLISRLGNDGNTLINLCGGSLAEDDSMQFEIVSCATALHSTGHRKPELSIYPNPAQGKIKLETGNTVNEGSVQILDINAKVLRSYQTPLPEPEIDIQDLTPGVYLLRCHTPEGVLVGKFLKL